MSYTVLAIVLGLPFIAYVIVSFIPEKSFEGKYTVIWAIMMFYFIFAIPLTMLTDDMEEERRLDNATDVVAIVEKVGEKGVLLSNNEVIPAEVTEPAVIGLGDTITYRQIQILKRPTHYRIVSVAYKKACN